MSVGQQPSKIGVATATIIGMNAMIGSGIFTAPATMASYVGPAGIVAYIAVVISVIFMALSLARLAELFPQEGSFYTYTYQWAGHIGGTIASALYIIGLTVAMGLLTKVSAFYLAELFPQISTMTFGILVLIALIILNICGMVLSQIGQHILIVCTIFPIIAITIVCLLHADIQNLFPFAPYGLSNILKATRVIIFGFFGFECATSLFSLVENPGKNVPKAIIYSILIVGILYTLFIASLILSTPLSVFTSPTTPLSTILATMFPEKTWLIMSIHMAILAAILGTIHSMMWGSSALIVSLAQKINKNMRSYITHNAVQAHRVAVLYIGIAIFIPFFFLSDMNIFFNITAITIITAIILSLITLLTIKKEWYNGRNIITLCGICTALTIGYFALEGLIEGLLNR